MATPNEGPDEYQLARQRAQQQANAAAQGQKDALKRRFAALGSVNSGAAIKQEQLVDQNAADQVQNATQQIDAAQRAEGRRVKEVEDNRKFAREERIGSQDFQGGQNALQRAFMTSERMGSQDFSRGERLSSQDFASGERKAGQDFASSQADKQMAFARGEREAGQTFAAQQSSLDRDLRASQFGQQMDLANKQLTEEQWVNRENLDIAKKMMEQKDFLEKLLNPTNIKDLPFGGILSTGLAGLGKSLGGVSFGGGSSFGSGTLFGGGSGGGGVTGLGF
jgi:hypothetical protein